MLSRYILANTEQLHEKIHQMSERIRQLEDTVEGFQAQNSSSQHPLLHKELLSIKSTQELYGTDRAYGDTQRPLGSEMHNEDQEVLEVPVNGLSRGIEVLEALFSSPLRCLTEL